MKKAFATAFAAATLSIAGAAALHAADYVSQDQAPVAEDTDGYSGVKIGTLTCDIGQGGGYLLGSAKELGCVFHSSFRGDRPDHYTGSVKKLGVDLGYTAKGKLVWAVFAPTAGYHHGSLGGIYIGASAEATLGAGIGANILVGGTNGSIQLQPLSISGQLGLNVAAASTTVTLNPVN